MINFKATLNGEDFEEFSIPQPDYSYSTLKLYVRQKLKIGQTDDFDIFGSDNKLLDTTMPSSSRCHDIKLALLNPKYQPSLYSQGADHDNSEDPCQSSGKPSDPGSKDKVDEMKDKSFMKKYSCSSSSCRKTFMSGPKLFTHIRNHFKNKPHK